MASREQFAASQSCSSLPKQLTEEEENRLKGDTGLVSEFKQSKLETDARRNWDLFYKRNSTKFFKDRHWTDREFNELCFTNADDGTSQKVWLEVGCGVGNAIFPILEERKNVFVFACDFSARAVAFVKEHPSYDAERCQAFECDLTVNDLNENIAANSVDVVTLIFVLSAILPSKMEVALRNIHKVLKPGGLILFRDYGLYDHAMLRFSSGHKLSDCFYVRQDGTRAYYFSTDKVEEVFTASGFETVQNDYIHRRTVNKKEKIDVPRIFVQGKFRKNTDTG